MLNHIFLVNCATTKPRLLKYSKKTLKLLMELRLMEIQNKENMKKKKSLKSLDCASIGTDFIASMMLRSAVTSIKTSNPVDTKRDVLNGNVDSTTSAT